MGRKRDSGTPGDPRAPYRIKVSTAAGLLDCDKQTVRRLIKRGVFTPVGRDQWRSGMAVFLDPKEVELYARGELDQLARYRAAKRRKSKRTSG